MSQSPSQPLAEDRNAGGGSTEARQRPESRLVQEAVKRANQGDTEAIHFLYVRYAQDVQRYVNGLVGNPREAEDITQGVFAKLFTVIGNYEQGDVPFLAWILGVARNAALDHMRTRRAIPTGGARFTDGGHARVGL